MELLVAMAIFSILAVGLQQIASAAASSFIAVRSRQELLANGRFAMDRIVAFVQETDAIRVPASNRLEVAERRLDIFDNRTLAFTPDGDSFLDADNDYNRRLNDTEADGPEQVVFRHDAAARTLLETLPNYSAPTPWLTPALETVICEQVKTFTCTRLGGNLVQIRLTLANGPNELILQTRAKARLVKTVQ